MGYYLRQGNVLPLLTERNIRHLAKSMGVNVVTIETKRKFFSSVIYFEIGGTDESKQKFDEEFNSMAHLVEIERENV